MTRPKTTTLGTLLRFEVVRPPDYPRGLRAYLHRSTAGRGFRRTYAVRPNPHFGEPGPSPWRIDLLGIWAEAVPGLSGEFSTPEDAAYALAGWLERGGRAPTSNEGLALLGEAFAFAARTVLGHARELVLSPAKVVVLRATF